MSAPPGVRLGDVLRFVDIAADALDGAREEIDRLNVYPVPDGDTGTNMFLTVAAARDALREHVEEAVEDDATGAAPALAAFARGALLGARGNSGVILSEMLGAVARRVAEARPGERNAEVMAEALQQATEASYAAVGTPVEGTMLTVCRAASQAAVTQADDPTSRARDVFAAAAAAAREAVGRTPEQLGALRDAGVVDAGGRGLSVILDAAEQVLTGRRPRNPPSYQPARPSASDEPSADTSSPPATGSPAYEVMFLLDASDDRVPLLRDRLGELGDSVVVVGGDRLWNVHAHVDDVGAAIEAGIEAGRPHRVQVTRFADRAGLRRPLEDASTTRRPGRGVVAVSAGPGLSELFSSCGAHVVEGGPGRRPSAARFLEAIWACGTEEVLILPNDPESARAARVAASTAESDRAGGVGAAVRVRVIPTQAQVQGLAALAVHDPARTFDQDVLEMTATARHARHGAVTIATRRAMTMAGPCEKGDVLGVVGGDFVVVGQDRLTVATEVLGLLLGGGGEIVTVVAGGSDGSDGSDGEDSPRLARASAAWVEEHHPAVDVMVYDGGQERYPLLVSVE